MCDRRYPRVAGLLLAVATSAAAANVPVECANWPDKPAWQWSDEERIAHRFEPECFAARVLQAASEKRPDGFCSARGTVSDFVFGTDTPELFLPWQLFDTAVNNIALTDSESSARWRSMALDRARHAGVVLPDAFWETFTARAEDYIRLLRQQQEMARPLESAGPSERRRILDAISESQRANCAARAAALARVREAFHGDLFDRFLYTAVASGVCASGDTPREALLWVSRGCS